MDKKRNINRLSLVFAVLIVMVVAFVLGNGFSRTTTITLPTTSLDASQALDEEAEEVIVPIVVTPDTVQKVIASLVRSNEYVRTIRMEQLWDGGSGLREVTVSQFGDCQRLDETLLDGREQHIITSADAYYLWYDEETQVYQTALGAFTPDQTLGIPTYEDVLALDMADILVASYDQLSGMRCIHVETAADEAGIRQRFWVSVDSGLLVAAERLEDDVSIYRMAVLSQEELPTPNALFVLPDGTVIV